jgi:hypothetical protein
MNGAKHALAGIELDTRIVKVIALVDENVLDTLRDMRGLLVVVTSAEHAHSVWGQQVGGTPNRWDEFIRHCTTGKAMADGASTHVQRSGTG